MVTEASISTLVSQGGGTERDVRGKGWDGVSKKTTRPFTWPVQGLWTDGVRQGRGDKGRGAPAPVEVLYKVRQGCQPGPRGPGAVGESKLPKRPGVLTTQAVETLFL